MIVDLVVELKQDQVNFESKNIIATSTTPCDVTCVAEIAAAAMGPTATTSFFPVANNSSTEFADLAHLAWRVKNLQRDLKFASPAWMAHCSNYNGVKDPYRHDPASLKLYVADPFRLSR